MQWLYIIDTENRLPDFNKGKNMQKHIKQKHIKYS